jgi:DNA-binding CsgD family transcriptional regulator
VVGAGERRRSIDYQVAAARAVFDAVAAGEGRVILVDGEPGTGRTTTLERLAVLARRSGLRTSEAAARPLDAAVPLGLARALHAPLPAELPSSGELAPSDQIDAALGLLEHAVVGSDAGACLLVDDVHWADAPSLRLVVHAARRLGDRPVALVLAMGPEVVDDDVTALLAELRATPGAVRIETRDLDPSEVGQLVDQRFDGRCPAELTARLVERTAGNPFLLAELLRHLDAAPEDLADPGVLDDLGEIVPPAVRDAVAVRIGRLGPEALGLARAVQVLGGDATVTRSAALAGLERRTAEDAADALVRATVLRVGPILRVVHPLAGEAVLASLEPFARGRLERAAAQLLVADGCAPGRVARHLLATAPAGEAWVVDQLRAAAGRPVEGGGWAAAAKLLRRALEEPPGEEVHTAVVRELAVAESRTGLPDAAARIDEALAAVTTTDDRQLLLRERTRLIWLSGRLPEAVQACEEAVAEASPGTELHAQLLAELLAVASMHDLAPIYARPQLVELLDRASGGWVPDSAPLAATLATVLPFVLGDHGLVGPLVDRAVEEDLWGVDATPFGMRPDFVIGGLWLTDRLAQARALIAEGMERVEPENLFRHGLLHFWLGEVRYAAGDLPGAIEAAAVALSPRWGPLASWFGFSSATLAHAHLDQGDAPRAEAVLDATAGQLEPGQLYAIAVDLARARLLLRLERPDEASRTVQLVSEQLGALGHRDSPQIVWRPLACSTAAALGDLDRARALAAEEVALARRTHARGRLGRALRTLATVLEDPAERLAVLDEARETLAGSERRLEHALALLALGQEHHVQGDTAAARSLLSHSRDLAVRCGAEVAAADALAALHATGARPRRSAQHGVEALTAAERRTVDLAAAGKTNREIGHLLAVAPRTVEWHLGRAFAKLGVTSRKELAAVLREPGRTG